MSQRSTTTTTTFLTTSVTALWTLSDWSAMASDAVLACWRFVCPQGGSGLGQSIRHSPMWRAPRGRRHYSSRRATPNWVISSAAPAMVTPFRKKDSWIARMRSSGSDTIAVP